MSNRCTKRYLKKLNERNVDPALPLLGLIKTLLELYRMEEEDGANCKKVIRLQLRLIREHKKL
jgi:hypothetical protein